MGTTLNGLTPAETYQGLLKTADNTALDTTLKVLSDGEGNDSALLVSTQDVTNCGGGTDTSNTAFGGSALVSNTAGANNSAFGWSALQGLTQGTNNVAMGYQALKTLGQGDNNIAIGGDALRQHFLGNDNIAIGNQAMLSGAENYSNLAIGNNALSSLNTSNDMLAIGTSSLSNCLFSSTSTALGHYAGVNASQVDFSVFIGQGAFGNDPNESYSQQSVFIGSRTGLENPPFAGGAFGSIAIGYNALVGESNTGSNTIAIGRFAVASGFGSNVIGSGAYAAGVSSDIIGSGSASMGGQSVLIGSQSINELDYGTLVGYQNAAVNLYSIGGDTVCGAGNQTKGADVVVLGKFNQASGINQIIVGNFTSAFADDSVSIGSGGFGGPSSVNIGVNSAAPFTFGSVAIGRNTVANGDQSTVIGYLSEGSDSYSTVIGAESRGAAGAIALGRGAFADGPNSLAIGTASSTSLSNELAIGSVPFPLGVVNAGAVTQTHSWEISINGTAYKILLGS